MTIAEALRDCKCVFLDTSPVIYYIERNPEYRARVDPFFDEIDNGSILAIASPITLAECLVVPLREARADVAKAFTDLITVGHNVFFQPTEEAIANRAAEMRCRYPLAEIRHGNRCAESPLTCSEVRMPRRGSPALGGKLMRVEP